MNEKNTIVRFFQRIVRESQRISFGQAICLFLGLFGSGLILCTILLHKKFSKEHAIASLLCFFLLAICSVFWALRNWFRERVWLYQAKKAEEYNPSLRGSLLCAIEIQDIETLSSIEQRIVRHAVEETKSIPITALVSYRPLYVAFSFFVATISVLLMMQIFSSLTPLDALASLREEVQQKQEKAAIDIPVEVVEIADISLEYTFPEYTKQDSILVRNSDGTIHAPKDSVVAIQARSKDAFQKAYIQVNEDEPIPVDLEEGVLLRTKLIVLQPGVWRFLLESEDKKGISEDFSIELDGDNPPVITLDSSPPTTLANNQSLNVQWQAEDDYGLKTIFVEYTVNGEKKTKDIRSFRNPKTKYKGRLEYTPKRLGLSSGDQVEMKIVAYDNQPSADIDPEDEFSTIGKRGESSIISFLVIGPKLQGERLIEANKDFLAALLPPLADFLVEKVPPYTSDEGMVNWSTTVQHRFDPLHDAMKKHWGDEIATDYTADLVLKVVDTSNRLMRFVRVTYGEKMGRVKKQDRDTFVELHQEQIVDLEKAVYLIDKMLRMAHFNMLLVAAEDALGHSKKINEMFSREGSDRQSKKNRLARLERALEDIDKATKGLAENSMKQFVELYRQQIDNLRTEMKERDAELDDEQYDTLLQELTESVEELHEGIQEQLRRQKDEEDKKSEEFKKLIEDLKKQKSDQLDLAQEIENSRAQFDQISQQKMKQWQELQRLVDDAQTASEQITRELGGGEGYRSGSLRQYDKQSKAIRDLQNAIKARDYEQAYRELSMAIRQNRSVQSQNYTEKNRERLASESQARNIDKVQMQSDRIERDLDQLKNKINNFDNSSFESPQVQQIAQEKSYKQQELNGKQADLEKRTKEVEQNMPTADGTASKSLKEATKSMEDAKDLLQMGRSIPGEGYQRDGAQKIQKTIDQLMQQQQEMEKMQQQAQQMSGQGKPGEEKAGAKSEDGQEISSNPLDLAEEMTPEEFRKRFLEGMSGAVPEEFQLLKKRYYEELVQQ